jgi:hypothetical protein
MTKDDIILMADASGLSWYGMGKDREKFLHYLEAFANLVAAAKPEHEPVAWMYPSDLEKFQRAETFAQAFSIRVGCPDEVSVPLYTTPPAAQRPWQGLTGEEVQFYTEKHSKLVNAGYDKVTDTNLVAKTFDSTGFYKEVSTVLKERNT